MKRTKQNRKISLNKHHKKIIFSLFIVVIFATCFFVQKNNLNKNATLLINEETKKRENITKLRNQIEEIQIKAKAVSVYNLKENKTIYGKNENQILPIASLTKIMTALVLLEEDFYNAVIVDSESIKATGDNGLQEGEIWKPQDLIKFSLITSSNDGIVALTQNNKNFIQKMNDKSKFLNLSTLSFKNPTGLDEGEHTAGGYGSAKEINKLAGYSYAKHPEIFYSTALNNIILKSKNGTIYKPQNTNIIIQNIPNLLFSKTGFTHIAGGNLTIIFENKNKQKIAITILGSSFEGRFKEMEKLVELLYNFEYEL